MSVLVLALALVYLMVLVVAERTVLIDCGSTGSRIYVYYFNPDSPLDTITEMTHRRIKPGLSSFVNDEYGIRKHVTTLVKFAKSRIPYHLWSKTTISLKATAGLRELPIADQQQLIQVASGILSSSGFLHNANETRVLTGEEEALYGLLGIMPGFKLKFDNHLYAVADLGGSSQQIAFIRSMKENVVEPRNMFVDDSEVVGEPVRSRSHGNAGFDSAECEPDFVLNIPGHGTLSIMARSLSQMGLIAAMDSVDNYIMNNILESNELSTSVTAACTSPGALSCSAEESAIRACYAPFANETTGGSAIEYLDGQPYYRGQGNFSRCVEDIRTALLPQLRKFIDFRCLQSHLPQTIIGIDNYPKVLEMLKLGGDGSAVTPRQIKERGEVVCRTPWEAILEDFPGFMPYRAQRACFGSSFIYVLLSDLYGIDSNTPESELVYNGTIFRPINNVEKQELGWAAGAAVYSALGLKYDTWIRENPYLRDGQGEPGSGVAQANSDELHRWTLDPDTDDDGGDDDSNGDDYSYADSDAATLATVIDFMGDSTIQQVTS
jgi:hypothetical protein